MKRLLALLLAVLLGIPAGLPCRVQAAETLRPLQSEKVRAGLEEQFRLYAPNELPWWDSVLEILEVADDPDVLAEAVREHFQAFGLNHKVFGETLKTLQAYPPWVEELRQIPDADHQDRMIPLLRLVGADQAGTLMKRLAALSQHEKILELLRQPLELEKRYLKTVAVALAEDPRPEAVEVWQSAQEKFQNLLESRWKTEGTSAQSAWLSAALNQFPWEPADQKHRRLPSGRFYLTSATLDWEGLLRALETFPASTLVSADLAGQQAKPVSLSELRNRLWREVRTWNETFSLFVELSDLPEKEGQRVLRITTAPEIFVQPLGEITRFTGEEFFFLRAGSVEALRRQIAERISDPDVRARFLAVPADDALEVDRQGRDLGPVKDWTKLAERDLVHPAVFPSLKTTEEIQTSAAALYAEPALFRRYFGALGHRGSYRPRWGFFLRALRQKNPEAYERLLSLPIPEGLSVHGDYLRYKPTGIGVLVTGQPGAGKSLLSALTVGDPKTGWNRPASGEQTPWEFIAYDAVLVLRIADRLFAGPVPGRFPKKLATRYPLEKAAPVEVRDAAGQLVRTIYETRIRAQWSFVPVRGLFWLNRDPSRRGSRKPEDLLGLTDETVGTLMWSPEFRERFQRQIRVQEVTVGSRAGLLQYGQMVRQMTEWASRWKPVELFGPPIGKPPESAGLEEGVELLEPGHERYAQTLGQAAERGVEAVLSGPLGDYLKDLPADRAVRLGIAGKTPKEEDEWNGFGLQPLVESQTAAWEALKAKLDWPNRGLTVTRRTEGGEKGRVLEEYVELTFLPGTEIQTAGLSDPIRVDTLRLYPAEADRITFDGRGPELKLTDRSSFLDQVNTLLETSRLTGRVRLVGLPLGLPTAQAKGDFITWLNAGRSDLEVARLQALLLTEAELQQRRSTAAAENSAGALSPTEKLAGQLQEETDQVRGDLERQLDALLQRPLGEAGVLGDFIDPGQIEQVRRELRDLTAQMLARKVVGQSGDAAERGRSLLQKLKTQWESRIDQLPDQPVTGSSLPPLIRRFLDRFPELWRNERLEMEQYRQLFDNKEIRKRGWTPARAAELLTVGRRVKRLVESRIPGFAWFSVVALSGEESLPSPMEITTEPPPYSLVVSLLYGQASAREVVEGALYRFLWATGKLLLFDDPEISPLLIHSMMSPMASARVADTVLAPLPSGQAALLQEVSSSEGTLWRTVSRKLTAGLSSAGHPRLEGEPLTALSESEIDTLLWGRSPLPKTGWRFGSLPLFAVHRLALMLGSGEAEGLIHREAERQFQLLEQRVERVSRRDAAEMNRDAEKEMGSYSLRKFKAGRLPSDVVDTSKVRLFDNALKQLFRGEGRPDFGRGAFFYDLLSGRSEAELLLADLAALHALAPLVSDAPDEFRRRVDNSAEKLLRILKAFQTTALGEWHKGFRDADWPAAYGRAKALYAQLRDTLKIRELRAGLEEGVELLEPGHERYAQTLGQAAERGVEAVLSGPLGDYLAGLPADQAVRLRVVGRTLAEQEDWRTFGLQPLAEGKEVLALLRNDLAWPKDGLEVVQEKTGERIDREYVEIPLRRPLEVRGEGLSDPVVISALRLFPKAAVTFQAAGVTLRLGAQERVPFLDQMGVLLGRKVDWVGVPWGLPTASAKETWVGLAGVLREDLPESIWRARILSEEEVTDRRRRAQEQVHKGFQETAAQQFQAEVESLRADLSGRIQRVQESPEGPYLSAAALARLQEEVNRLSAQTFMAGAAVSRSSPVAGWLAVYRKGLSRWHRAREQALAEIDRALLEGAELQSAVERLQREFPELQVLDESGQMQGAVEALVQGFSGPEARQERWGPVLAARLLRQIRATGERLKGRLGGRWFDGVEVRFDPSPTFPVNMLVVEGRGKEPVFFLVIYPLRVGQPEPVVDLNDYVLVRAWEIVSFLLELRRSPRLEQTFRKGPLDLPDVDWGLWEGRIRPDWIELPGSPPMTIEDRLLASWVEGGEQVIPGTGWSMSAFVTDRAALLLEDAQVTEGIQRVYDAVLGRLERALAQRQPLEQQWRDLRKDAAEVVIRERRRLAHRPGPLLQNPLTKIVSQSPDPVAQGVNRGSNRLDERLLENETVLATLAAFQALFILEPHMGQDGRLERVETLRRRILQELEVEGKSWFTLAHHAGVDWAALHQSWVDAYVAYGRAMRFQEGGVQKTGLEELPAAAASELHVAVIAPSAMQKYPQMEGRANQLLGLGENRYLLFLSADLAGLEEPLTALLGKGKPIHVWQYGEADDPALAGFQRLAAPFSWKFRGPLKPQGPDARVFLARVLLALAGLEESADLQGQALGILDEVLSVRTST